MSNKPINTNDSKNKGMVYVFTGEGKGKTSAALGVGVRAALNGMKVGMVCWYKEEKWQISDKKIASKIKNFKVYLLGRGFYLEVGSKKYGVGSKKFKQAKLDGGGNVIDGVSEKEHKKAAEEALEKARKLIGKVDVLILDEVNNAVFDKLIKAEEVVDLLGNRRKTHVVLTGRKAPKVFLEMADLVTEMRKVKHPFDLGKKAVKGLDY